MKFKNIFTGALLLAGAVLSAAPYARVNKIADARKIDWSKAVSITGFSKVSTLDYAGEQTTLRLLYDGKFLYGKVDCIQKNIGKLSEGKIRDDKMLWKNNSVELFFHANQKLHHLILNTEGTVWDMVGDDSSWNGVTVLKHQKSKGSWSTWFKIPLRDLSFDGKGKISFNIVRNNYDQKEFSSWSPFEKYNWLQTGKYGTLELAKSEQPCYGISFKNLPETHPSKSLNLSVISSAPATILTEFRSGEKWCHRRSKAAAGTQEIQVQFLSASGKKMLKTSIFAGNTKLCVMEYNPRGDFLEVFGEPFYTLSAVKEMPTSIHWNSVHSMNVHNGNGNRFDTDYEILFDVPEGVEVLNTVPAGVSTHGPKRKVVSSKRKQAYNAANWIADKFYATLPQGSEGTIYFRVKWKNFLQKEQKFNFKVFAFAPAPAPKKLVTYFYNQYNSSVKTMSLLRKYGINTQMYRNWDVKEVKALKAAGFYIIRGGYFFPGGHGAYHEWPKFDRAARALDIEGNVINGAKGTPQFSPSYRGKFFKQAIEKERKFAIEAGISHFAFDMEGYIMPNAEIACFRPETIARFRQWFAGKHPGKKYISPLEFEKEPEKYPEYHDIWIDFKDFIFADFLLEFKRQMNLPASAKSVPWEGNITISEWAYAIPRDKAAINKNMRGPQFLQAFGWFEQDSYTSADRTIREVLYKRELVKKLYPQLKLNIIFCPSPERLDLNNRSSQEDFYYSPAPILEDELKYKIFDNLSTGMKGISVWNHVNMTARAWRNLTEALRAIVKVENVILEGQFIENLRCNQPLGVLPEVKLFNRQVVLKNQPKILVKGVRKGNEAVISVSEYMDLKPVTVTVTCPVQKKAVVTDLETGEKIGEIQPGINTFKVKLDQRRCRLLHIVEK